jgi:hypothetical protein
MGELTKSLLSAVAVAITVFAFLPYIRGILRGTFKPHVFSWVIWGVTTLVVFFAQWQAKGGVGTYAIGVSALLTLLIAGLAFVRRADTSITSLDWTFFVAALASLPLWFWTTDPTAAVVLLTIVDVLGFGPTVRKVYDQPHAESAGFFALFMLRNALVILALENYSVATVLFPAAVAVACGVVVGLMMIRRRAAVVPR